MAVSKKFTPSSSPRLMISRECASSSVQLCWPFFASPKPMHPMQMRETFKSELPSFVYCIVFPPSVRLPCRPPAFAPFPGRGRSTASFQSHYSGSFPPCLILMLHSESWLSGIFKRCRPAGSTAALSGARAALFKPAAVRNAHFCPAPACLLLKNTFQE